MDVKKIIKDTIILTIITLIAGVGLGFVYKITLEPIAQAEAQATQDAYRAVFADAAEFEDFPESFDNSAALQAVVDSGYVDGDINNCVQALDGSGNLLGYVVTVTSHAGYGGDIVFSVGITTDMIVNGYSITTISETAGLGMKAKEEAFSSQFNGKQVDAFEVTKSGSTSDAEIDAISGATITSKAVTYGVNGGMTYVKSIMEETGGVVVE